MTRIERMLIIATTLLASTAGIGWYASVPRGSATTRSTIRATSNVTVTPPESITAAASHVAATDPFRLERRPALVAYRPELEGGAPPPKPPKPRLVLDGIVGAAALLDGIPGQSGTAILRAGDTLGGLRVRRVGRDTIVVAGADTIWKLTLRQSWQ